MVRCPFCDKGIRLSDSLRGRKVKCKCGRTFRMPGEKSTDDEHQVQAQFAAKPKPMRLTCSSCSKAYDVQPSMIGRAFRCKCGATIHVNEMAESAFEQPIFDASVVQPRNKLSQTSDPPKTSDPPMAQPAYAAEISPPVVSPPIVDPPLSAAPDTATPLIATPAPNVAIPVQTAASPVAQTPLPATLAQPAGQQPAGQQPAGQRPMQAQPFAAPLVASPQAPAIQAMPARPVGTSSLPNPGSSGTQPEKLVNPYWKRQKQKREAAAQQEIERRQRRIAAQRSRELGFATVPGPAKQSSNGNIQFDNSGAIANIAIGGIVCLIGIGVTVGTYVAASGKWRDLCRCLGCNSVWRNSVCSRIGATVWNLMTDKYLTQDASGVKRCWWCGDLPIYIQYHDTEWGRPVRDDRRLYEKICLEGFQSGLSWITILRKREAFRKAFQNFELEKVARFSQRKVDQLLQNPDIVRHRGKIEATINNAARAIELIESTGSLADFFWDFEPKTKREFDPQRGITPESQAMSKQLKKLGWKFVGPTTCYSFMQSMGIVNDHHPKCFVHSKL